MPEVDKNSLNNNQKLIDFMNNGYKLSSPKNFINSVKLLNNSNKFIEVSNKLNKRLYADNITDNNEDKKAKLEKNIDSILEELEKKFDEKMEQIENEIILPKDDTSIYTSRKVILKFVKDPTELVYKEDICGTAHKTNSIDKVFCAFKSLSGESLVVWGTPQYSIEFYDLEKGKIIKTIPNAHNQTIFSCRHYVDYINNIDYIITSSYDKTVKTWDLKNFQNILNIKNPHSGYYIYSVNILCDQKEGANYIITSAPNEYMKVFDFSGNYLRSFGQNDESTYFIDTYCDSKEGVHYVINANSSDVKSYEFKTGKLYHKYKGSPQTWHMSAIVNETKEQQILIESDGNGYIRMWEFHTGNLIKTIPSSVSLNLRGICLWNDDYLLAAGNDYQVKLFDLAQGKFIKSFKGHTSTVCSIEKIVHPKYGECLISQGLDGKLKLWIPNPKN
jgi:WD40 repeat protein